MKTTTARFAVYAAIAVILILIGAGIYRNVRRTTPLIFSPHDMLTSIWGKYKIQYLEPDTFRTLDKQRGNITTSEGQSYTMLRAVWLDDHETFDASWKWTQDNLQLPRNHLFSWLFGPRPDGTYGILTNQNGQNTASDADTDIALALAFAYARWRDPAYLQSAHDIIVDIWNEEVIIIRGKPYLAADNVEKNYPDNIVVNPSYFAPYAYRIFAEIDRDHDWKSLVSTSYDILEKSMAAKLNASSTAGLPPDWISLGRSDASIHPSKQSSGLDTNYSFDALRVPWRLALDWYWYREPRARTLLSSMSFLGQEWKNNRVLHDIYGHDGRVVDATEAPSMYGGSLAVFLALDGTDAKDIYENKLVALYNPDIQSWSKTLGYYDDNWAWFGMALYNNELPNLWASVK